MSAIDGAPGALKAAGTRSRGGLLQRHEWLRGYLLMSPTMLLMLLMLIVPIIALVIISFWTQDLYSIDTTFTLDNYWHLVEPGKKTTYWWGIPFPLLNPVYAILLVKSVILSLMATAAVILLAYPMAYFLAFRVTHHKVLWLILITIPFWTSYLLRVFAWKIILGQEGILNGFLLWAHLIDQPVAFLLYSKWAVIIALIHIYTPFTILPIYAALEHIPRNLVEASHDLGASPVQTFWRVIFPLSIPGVLAVATFAFVLSMGDFVGPLLMGGPSGIMISNIVYSWFGAAYNWPLGAAISFCMLALVLALLFLSESLEKKWSFR